MKCQVCNKEFGEFRLLGLHVTVSHKIEREDYYLQYINPNKGVCKLCSDPTRFISIAMGYARCCGNRCAKLLDSKNPEYRKKISATTKVAMQREDVKKHHMDAVARPKSDETIRRMSVAAKQRYIADPTLKNRIYTVERNKKISNFKVRFWKENPEEKKRVGNIWKMWKERDEVGWRKHLAAASKKGFEKIFSPNGDTSLEIKLYSMLKSEGIPFKKKHNLDHKIYDAYLPSHNVLIEIDGDFWHKQSLEECKYEFQKESFYNDRKKEDLARSHNIRLIRIKEREIPNKIADIL